MRTESVYKRIIQGLECKILDRKLDLALERDENLKKRIKRDVEDLENAHFSLTGDKRQEFLKLLSDE